MKQSDVRPRTDRAAMAFNVLTTEEERNYRSADEVCRGENVHPAANRNLSVAHQRQMSSVSV